MKKIVSSLLVIVAVFASSFAAFAQSSTTDQKRDISITTVIDPGSELITIMLWLSGKYPTPMDSKYKSDVWAWFSKHKNSSFLDRIKKSEMYPNFTEMGLLLSDFPAIKVDVPAANSWYEKKGGKENIVGILNDAKDFAGASGFWKFFQKHTADYAQMTNGFNSGLKSNDVLPAIDAFFRYGESRELPEVTIYLEPLNNWGAHAIDFQRLRGEPNGKRVVFQIGPVEQDMQLPDSPLVFEANRLTIQNVWHEASHIYLKNSLAVNKDRIAKLGSLFNPASLASQNIKTWDYAFEENLVRSIVAVMTREKFGEDAFKREISGQTQRGFIYTKEMADLMMSKYLGEPAKYSTFDDLVPDILAALENKQNPAGQGK